MNTADAAQLRTRLCGLSRAPSTNLDFGTLLANLVLNRRKQSAEHPSSRGFTFVVDERSLTDTR
jgi:hypothetical protein